MKLLIIRFSSIGDIVLTTPVIRCLKKQLPDAKIHFLIKPQFRSIIDTNPYVDKVHVLQDDWDKMIEEVKEEKFDHLIDLHHNLRTLRVKKALKVPAVAYDKENFRKLVFIKLKWNVMPGDHVVDRYMKTVEPFGIKNDGQGLDYFIPKEQEIDIHDIPTSHQAGYVALVIGASYYTKKLPMYKLKELCNKIMYPVVLLGGKEEYLEGEEIRKDCDNVYNGCGKFTLHESADLVRKSKLVISHDTGLMHIAAALEKEIIAIWGSTTPSFGFEPYYGERYLMKHAKPFDNIEVHKLWCRPCTRMGRHHCPQGHFKCMKKLDIDELVRKVNMRLGRAFS